MGKYLDNNGLNTLWTRAKQSFAPINKDGVIETASTDAYTKIYPDKVEIWKAQDGSGIHDNITGISSSGLGGYALGVEWVIFPATKVIKFMSEDKQYGGIAYSEDKIKRWEDAREESEVSYTYTYPNRSGTFAMLEDLENLDIPTLDNVYFKGEIDSKLTKDNLISIIGEATSTLSGLMSAQDKTNLDTLVSLLSAEEDENVVVDRINEILSIFNQYPEGVDLVSALAGKANKNDIPTDYLPLSAGSSKAVTGVLHTNSGIKYKTGTTCNNTKGVVFDGNGDKTFIGGSTAGGIGIYAYSEVYFRPGMRTDASAGLKMTRIDFSPTTNKSMSLGTSSMMYNYIYGAEIYQNEKQVANKEDIPTKTSQLTNDSNFAVTTSSQTFIQENTFTSKTYAPTWVDIASGIGKSSKFTRGAFMQLVTGQILLPNASCNDTQAGVTGGYNTEANKLKFQTMTANSGQPVVKTVAEINSNGIFQNGKQVANKEDIPTLKTINGQSIVGSGDITISGGSSGSGNIEIDYISFSTDDFYYIDINDYEWCELEFLYFSEYPDAFYEIEVNSDISFVMNPDDLAAYCGFKISYYDNGTFTILYKDGKRIYDWEGNTELELYIRTSSGAGSNSAMFCIKGVKK